MAVGLQIARRVCSLTVNWFATVTTGKVIYFDINTKREDRHLNVERRKLPRQWKQQKMFVFESEIQDSITFIQEERIMHSATVSKGKVIYFDLNTKRNDSQAKQFTLT